MLFKFRHMNVSRKLIEIHSKKNLVTKNTSTFQNIKAKIEEIFFFSKLNIKFDCIAYQ